MSQSWGSARNILMTVRWFLQVCLHMQVTRQELVSHTFTVDFPNSCTFGTPDKAIGFVKPRR